MDSDRKFFNQSQPQTLVIAQLLLYFNAAFGLLSVFLGGGIGLIGLVVIAGQGAGAFGIANEKRWGYILSCVASVLIFGFWLWIGYQFHALGNLNLLITLIFDGALVALLFHPQSREYQKIWFR